MTRGGKAALLAGLLSLACACAPAVRKAAVPAPQPVDWTARLAEADGLSAAGHYAALRGAHRIYGEALASSVNRAGVAERYIRAAIALGLRERELGILSTAPSVDPARLIAADPSLARYGPWLELLAGLPHKIKGTPGIDRVDGRTLEEQMDWVAARIPDLDRELARAASGDDLAACLRLALRTAFFYKFQDKFDAGSYRDLHARSCLVAFQAAVSPSINPAYLEFLLAGDPAFAEIHYYFGEEALAAGNVLTAERHYLAVHEKIPESLSVLISLAKVAFQMEEMESCLEWNERALALLPTYRDALLGKGLSLSFLGRRAEALAVLGRLLELGSYYMGEGHYWTAWNLHELGRLEEARKAIDSAKIFLVEVVDVHTLSGIIAYRQGRQDDAEADLRHALNLHSSESDAAYYLGRLYADRKDWLNSGIYFAGAALSYEEKEKGLEDKIGEIEASEMAPARKAILVLKKQLQIQSVQATKATCQYNGAAGYHNAGSFERALDLARLAAAHPAFAEKAAELIKLIRER